MNTTEQLGALMAIAASIVEGDEAKLRANSMGIQLAALTVRAGGRIVLNKAELDDIVAGTNGEALASREEGDTVILEMMAKGDALDLARRWQEDEGDPRDAEERAQERGLGDIDASGVGQPVDVEA